jgi:hypothetical protein
MAFITADQLVAHAIGDYVTQSDWMATEKTKRSVAALVHSLVYSLGFLVFSPSATAFAFIAVTHFVIDRWRLARYVVWAKNWLAPWSVCPGRDYEIIVVGVTPTLGCQNLQRHSAHPVAPTPPWAECQATGYPPDRPIWLAFWLMIIVDNMMHVACNAAALRWL